MTAGPHIIDLKALAAAIPDGSSIAIPPDYSGVAMEAVKALIRRGARNLQLIGVPSGGYQADWLIGAGCVASIEAAAMTLGEQGTPPRFVAALRAGTILMKDATCPVIHAGLQAAEKGIPFMPLRGIIGSDLLAHRQDWRLIDNPFAEGQAVDPILLVPAIKPDFALFHARAADRDGNVFIGVRRELMLMSHAARRTFVTVERIEEDIDFLRDDAYAAGTIPSLYVSSIAVVPGGARPVGLVGDYGADTAELATYAKAAQTDDGFKLWLAENVTGAVAVRG